MTEQKLNNLDEDLIEHIEDVKTKLDDCVATLRAGKELDSIQQAFLRSIEIN